MNEVNLDREVEFFGPHQGIMGAAVPAPKKVQEVAAALDGTKGMLREAVEQVKQAYPEGDLSVHEDMMVLLSSSGPVMHSWRVIRYR